MHHTTFHIGRPRCNRSVLQGLRTHFSFRRLLSLLPFTPTISILYYHMQGAAEIVHDRVLLEAFDTIFRPAWLPRSVKLRMHQSFFPCACPSNHHRTMHFFFLFSQVIAHVRVGSIGIQPSPSSSRNMTSYLTANRTIGSLERASRPPLYAPRYCQCAVASIDPYVVWKIGDNRDIADHAIDVIVEPNYQTVGSYPSHHYMHICTHGSVCACLG